MIEHDENDLMALTEEVRKYVCKDFLVHTVQKLEELVDVSPLEEFIDWEPIMKKHRWTQKKAG